MADVNSGTEAREIPIYQSPNRPNLILGCDREALLSVGLLCAMLIFSIARLWALVVGLVAWVAAVAVLSRMAKVDPLMRHTYVRHVRYKGFYAAKSGRMAQAVEVGKSWIRRG